MSDASAFRFIDLFAGIGGLRRGFESIGGVCVFTSEWDKFARKTYATNFADGPNHPFAGDITKVDEATVRHLEFTRNDHAPVRRRQCRSHPHCR